MDEVIGQNIRAQRDERAWTQEHLAQAAGVNVRTVQRAEAGRGLSADALLGIAAAFDVSIDELRFDAVGVIGRLLGVPRGEVTTELIEAHAAKIKEQYEMVPLTLVQRSGDLVVRGHGHIFQCSVDRDDARDVAAELQSYVKDMIDIGDEMDPMNVREAQKQMFEIVKRLDALGCAVGIGKTKRVVPPTSSQSLPPWEVLVLVVGSKAVPPTVAVLEREHAVSAG